MRKSQQTKKAQVRTNKKFQSGAKKSAKARGVVAASAAPEFNPVLSAIVSNVDGSGGETMSFTAEVADMCPQISFGEDVSRRWLCSTYYDSGGAQVKVTARETDPGSDDTFDDNTVALGEPSPSSVTSPTNGSTDIEVKMTAGDKDYDADEDNPDESASYTVTVDWYASPSILDVIEYVLATATAALQTDSLQNAKEFNATVASDLQRGDVFSVVALGLVDPTPALRNPMDSLFEQASSWALDSNIRASYGSVALDKDRGLLYDAEVWEPLAFGFVGGACGIMRTGALEGFGVWKAQGQGVSVDAIENALRSGRARSYASDSEQAAVAVGYALWSDNGASVTRDDVLEKLRASVSRFKTDDAAEGVPPVSLRDS